MDHLISQCLVLRAQGGGWGAPPKATEQPSRSKDGGVLAALKGLPAEIVAADLLGLEQTAGSVELALHGDPSLEGGLAAPL